MPNVTDACLGKIWTYEALSSHLQEIRDKQTILVGGCFDIFHYGHLQFLKQSRSKGDVLVVALEPDDFIRRNKGKIPVHTQHQRAELLASLIFVSAVILLPYFRDPREYDSLVEQIKPAGIAVTEGDPRLAEKKKQADSIGADIYVFPVIKPFSSSSIHNYETILGD